ncbi:MAG: SPOR domain-containing protein [Glaciimonas sp.]|nr:SPOR domain-containing protein [Glaciimonas sp.]
MRLFSFLGKKKKQESTPGAPDFTSRSEEESHIYRNRSNRSKKNPDGASQAPSEAALPEKKRARRRLIGAIALVLAAIIGLPMLFDSEQKWVPDDIAIQIPSMDTPVTAPAVSPTMPAPPVAAGVSSSGPVSASTALSRQEKIIDLVRPPAVAPAPVTGSSAAQQAPVVGGALHKTVPETKPAPKSEPRQEPKPEPLPVPKPEQANKTDEAARARAILEGRPVAAVEERTSPKFVLQIVALANQEKVDELQRKLKEAGIKSYTQKISTKSGTPIRVRVGPFSSKEDAEKMRAKLVRLGFGGTLVPIN